MRNTQASTRSLPLPDHFPSALSPTSQSIRQAFVVSALSRALDLSTGQPLGHSVRACLLGMRIAAELGVSSAMRNELFYALLLKDCGCSGNASQTFHALAGDDLKAKRDVKTTDWTRTSWETFRYALAHVAPGRPFLEKSRALLQVALRQKAHARDVTKVRCERGAKLAVMMGLSHTVASGILNLDEHWDGSGNPDGFFGAEIPLLSRIMLLAQTLEVFAVTYSPAKAVQIAQDRSKRWFDPDLVRATYSLYKRNSLFTNAFSDSFQTHCLETEPDIKTIHLGDSGLDRISCAFADIVDAKSPFTFNHSQGVANAAVNIAQGLGLSHERILMLRNAALLHDLGKLGVSNTILEKPGKLDDEEWQVMKLHPYYTWEILRTIPGLAELSEIAGSHHEKLDGSGYFRSLTAAQLSIESRILAVADVFDALSAKRPYRDALPREKVFAIMKKGTPHELDASCVEALEQSGAESNQTYINLHNLSASLLAANRAPRDASRTQPVEIS